MSHNKELLQILIIVQNVGYLAFFAYICIVIEYKHFKTIITMSTLKKIFASKLLEVKAIKLQPNDPFTWASGWKSPIYTDNRKTLAYPELRSFV